MQSRIISSHYDMKTYRWGANYAKNPLIAHDDIPGLGMGFIMYECSLPHKKKIYILLPNLGLLNIQHSQKKNCHAPRVRL